MPHLDPASRPAATPTPHGGLLIPTQTVAFIATALERMGEALITLDGRTGILEAAPTSEPELVNNRVPIEALDALTHMLNAREPGPLELQPQQAMALRRAVYEMTQTLMAQDAIRITEEDFPEQPIGLFDVIELGRQVIDALGPCPDCRGQRWVCEMHPKLPWDVPGGCSCSEGVPCMLCNPCDRFHAPEIQPDMELYASTRAQPSA